VRTTPLRDALGQRESPDSPEWDVVEVRLRLPRKLMTELKGLAASESLSLNAMVASFIDAALVKRGRKSIVEVAPWFTSYLRGAGKLRRHSDVPDGEDADPDFT
jgi:hypothetical protein